MLLKPKDGTEETRKNYAFNNGKGNETFGE
jgi:hypothetical protein